MTAERAFMSTYETVDILPTDTVVRDVTTGQLIVHRRVGEVDKMIHLVWKNLTEYAEWCKRNLGKSLSESDKRLFDGAMDQIISQEKSDPQKG